MKNESNVEKQKQRRRQFVEQHFKGDENSAEILLNGFRHLYTYFDVYWLTFGHAIRPQRLKQLLMQRCHEPESTARSHVKALIEEDNGMFYYDKEQDVLFLDECYTNEFLRELNYLLNGRGDWKFEHPEDAYTKGNWSRAEDTDKYWDEVYDIKEEPQTKQP
ncbi:MAG: hypothetical protein K6E75_00540 [Lachnospiraceae bacterium]|nr:hypothetical protein [Lachnospiraceae bacterium]